MSVAEEELAAAEELVAAEVMRPQQLRWLLRWMRPVRPVELLGLHQWWEEGPEEGQLEPHQACHGQTRHPASA